MANLATRETPSRSLPQRTFRRETTMPRQATERPDREVNARIFRPNDDSAQELQKILGLATETVQGLVKDAQGRADKRDAADASLDFQTGAKDEDRFEKSRVYRDIYQREGAKKLGLDISQEVTEKVSERLNDADHPATIEDVDHLIEEIYRSHLYDESGNLLDFGTPEAKTILGNTLREVKANILPEAVKAIKTQMDSRVLGTIAHNFFAEHDRGAPLGEAPPAPAQVDPLAPLPDNAAAPKRSAPVSLGKPTGKLPVAGPITATFAEHGKRGSAGIDIDGKMNDPISAPAGGKVIEVGSDPKSGLFVKVDHGNGVVSSYAHLFRATVKKGEIVRPGQQIAAMGNSGHVSHRTGDGSHLHYRVRVNGKDVDPSTFRYGEGGSWEEGPDLVGSPVELAAGAPPPRASQPVNFEELMKRIPPSVDKGEAKAFFLQAVINEANDRNDPSLLAGLEDTMRSDGSPSFNPRDVASIISAREAIGNRARADAERLEKEVYEKNEDAVLEALLSDNPPSLDFIRKAAIDGKVRDEWAFSMVHAMESEARREVSEAKALAREDEREADAEVDMDVSSMIAARMSGDLRGVSPQSDLALFNSGQLGSGKKAAARLRSLSAAARNGEQVLRQNPQYATFAAMLKQQLDPAKSAGGSLLARRLSGGGTSGNKVAYAGAIALYRDKVSSGVAPEEAYRSALQVYGPKAAAKPDQRSLLEQRRAALLAKQNAGR